MPRTTHAVLACALTLGVSGSVRPEGEMPGVSLENTRVATLSSSTVEQDYRIDIALPYGYESSEKSYPVVYLLDSDALFGLVTDVSRLLPLEGVPVFLGRQRVPELIIVGIGYPGGVAEMSNKRGRDMNPPEGSKGEINPRGAADFYSFLSDDLIPWVESNYRAAPTDRTLLGASRGGVFVLSTLFLHPETFRRYVAISPVIEPPIAEYLERYSARENRPQARLFLSAGSSGDLEKGIAEGVKLLTSRLDELGPGNLDWSAQNFDGDTHVSVVPRALVSALTNVFSEPSTTASGD